MALARWDTFSPRKADRLFGSVVRYWVTARGELTSLGAHCVALRFACGCHWSAQNEPRRRYRFCHRHRGQAS